MITGDIKFLTIKNFCINILFCSHYFSPLNTFLTRKGSGAGSVLVSCD
jgi:hypothetical protein